MPYIITEACINIKDKSCVDVCPVDCIYEGPEMLYIHPDECIDCGACEPECPVTAIFPEEDVSACARNRRAASPRSSSRNSLPAPDILGHGPYSHFPPSISIGCH